jgi:hydrogenase expression/formation protein HypE
MENDNILLGHGSGGRLSHELVEKIFLKYFGQPDDSFLTDSSLIKTEGGLLAYTTDSFVVDPIFFPGGDIGKLAVCGTVNDLAVSGAVPKYLSAGFIIEEGFSIIQLETIVKSMAKTAEEAGVKIVTGDTKVVNKNKCDKIFINTSGIGFLAERHKGISKGEKIKAGDKIIINGFIADHGLAVMSKRDSASIKFDGLSDCAPLNHLIQKVLQIAEVRFMRDATRGGLATVLVELAEQKKTGIEINEIKIPVRDNAKGMCELLGFDPLYIANEGKIVVVVSSEDADAVLTEMKKHPLGKDSSIIGEITGNHKGMVVMQTSVGGKRIIDMPAGELLPRIC